MESRRKRVEQKGRFTITEIIPGSPYASQVSSSTFLDDVPTTSSSSDGVATIHPMTHHNQLEPVENKNSIKLVVGLKIEERPSEKSYMQPANTSLVSNEETSLIIVSQTDNGAIDSTHDLSTLLTASTTDSALGELSRKYLSPKKSRDSVQRARRIKRRGRFTIIEMASDSPTSRKDSDELCDHRFVTTTSVGGSTVESLPQQHSRSLDAMERRTKPKRTTRSMPRFRHLSSVRRSRRQSKSPAREHVEPVDMDDLARYQQHQQEAITSAEHQDFSVIESTDALDRITLTSAMGDETGVAASPCASESVSMTGITIPDSKGTVPASTSAFCSTVPLSQLVDVFEMNGNSGGVSQSSSMPISAAQYLQQQQTIASLIRQQHDLKQIIGVLQEQQQLMSIPSQINKLNRQNASTNDDWNRDDEMRELSMQVHSLTAANESLHSLLDAAEREARHRKLQIECLSEENDELRQRCGQLELYLESED